MKPRNKYSAALAAALLLFARAGAYAGSVYLTTAEKLAKDMAAGAKVCVMPFLYIGAGPDSRGGAVVSERLNTELIKKGGLQVLERRLLDKVLAQLKLQGGGPVDEAQAKKAGGLLGADYVVSGSIFKKTDGTLELNARAVETATGLVKAAVKTPIKEDWLEKFPELPPGGTAGNEAFSLCTAGLYALDGMEFEKAAEFFTKAIALEESGACGMNIPGMAYMARAMANKNISGPGNDAQEEVPDNPGYDYSLEAKDENSRKAAELDKGLVRYGALLKAMPDNDEAYYARAVILSKKERYREALIDCDAAIKLAPGKARYHYVRGQILPMLRLYDNAVSALSESLKLDPRYSRSYNGRGIVYAALKQYGKAKADYDKAIELEPGEPLTYSNRAGLFMHLEQYGKAVKDFDKALELKPGLVEGYYGRGLALTALKRYDRAIKDFDKALELRPGYKPALKGRAEAADKKSGKFDKYDGDMKKAQELFDARDED